MFFFFWRLSYPFLHSGNAGNSEFTLPNTYEVIVYVLSINTSVLAASQAISLTEFLIAVVAPCGYTCSNVHSRPALITHGPIGCCFFYIYGYECDASEMEQKISADNPRKGGFYCSEGFCPSCCPARFLAWPCKIYIDS